MRRLIAVAIMAVSLAAAPAYAGYGLARYNCDLSHGPTGLLQDYVAGNGLTLLWAAWSLIPKPFKAELFRLQGTLITDLEQFRAVASALKLGAGVNTNPRLDLNAITHFACFEITHE